MKASRIVVLVLLPLFASLGTGCVHSTPPQPSPATAAETADLQRAVSTAVSALHEQSHDPADGYILVSAQQIVVRGRYTWRITFKPIRLIPKDPSNGKIGAGGEVFVNIDSITQKLEIRFGE